MCIDTNFVDEGTDAQKVEKPGCFGVGVYVQEVLILTACDT